MIGCGLPGIYGWKGLDPTTSQPITAYERRAEKEIVQISLFQSTL
jgi:hypothetical protein